MWNSNEPQGTKNSRVAWTGTNAAAIAGRCALPKCPELHLALRDAEAHRSLDTPFRPLNQKLVFARAHDQDRTRGVANHALGGAAEHRMGQPIAPMRREDDQIRGLLARLLGDFVRGVPGAND